MLEKNALLARQNRDWLAGRDILALDLVSSPGSGTTSLLERTIRDLSGTLSIAVIEGDRTGCLVEAGMVQRALEALNPARGSVVMIESVGNRVSPALFDLGERAKVAILSVTDGDDKPSKYPQMFAGADLMVINKIDLLPYVQFDVMRCISHARMVRPGIDVISLSAVTGENAGAWYSWIEERRPVAASRRSPAASR